MTSAAQIWDAALGELQIQVNRINYQTWLKDTVGLENQEHLFVVGVANPFAAEWLERRLKSLVKKTLMGILGHELEVQFQVHAKGEAIAQRNLQSKAHSEEACSPRNGINGILPSLKPCYTFDNFIVGSGNCLAYTAALKVADNPGSSYNPLFIYGGAGLGKTHLLYAIGHVATTKSLPVLFVSAEQFTNDYLTSIREKNTEEFRTRYRGTKLLLVDDIQFLIGKEQTQEGFFHTFNELHNCNNQIVITSDRAPKAMPLLDERLRSRFEWGLVADVQPPDYGTRLEILKAKLKQQKMEVSQEVLTIIAQRVQRNIRGLEGALNRVLAYAKMTNTAPTPELAAKALDGISPRKEEGGINLSPQQISDIVATYFNLPPEALSGKKRDQRTALARQIAMYLIREEIHLPLMAIGRQLGGRDHSTVLHGYEKIAFDLNANPRLRQQVQDIRGKLYPPKK